MNDKINYRLSDYIPWTSLCLSPKFSTRLMRVKLGSNGASGSQYFGQLVAVVEFERAKLIVQGGKQFYRFIRTLEKEDDRRRETEIMSYVFIDILTNAPEKLGTLLVDIIGAAFSRGEKHGTQVAQDKVKEALGIKEKSYGHYTSDDI